ncbi:uncharacterized protein LODBEIA_P06060 [Lodderomyces beijingensis]|uniref:Tricalbin n=1 Tax=Lodderomyces beijingensis TaxID=1775926 RepID=A0ABP0ZG24_9ASCO
MTDVVAPDAAGGATNPNDLLSPPPQVKVDQSVSAGEALEPEKVKEAEKLKEGQANGGANGTSQEHRRTLDPAHSKHQTNDGRLSSKSGPPQQQPPPTPQSNANGPPAQLNGAPNHQAPPPPVQNNTAPVRNNVAAPSHPFPPNQNHTKAPGPSPGAAPVADGNGFAPAAHSNNVQQLPVQKNFTPQDAKSAPQNNNVNKIPPPQVQNTVPQANHQIPPAAQQQSQVAPLQNNHFPAQAQAQPPNNGFHKQNELSAQPSKKSLPGSVRSTGKLQPNGIEPKQTKSSSETKVAQEPQSKEEETGKARGEHKSSPGLLIPSEDFDLSNVKTKPPPRPSVEPTFRGWKEVGGYEEDDALTAADETVDLLSKGSIFDQYLPTVMYGDWYHNSAYLILGGLLSWLVGWLRFSVAPLFFIMVVFALLYRASVKKYRGLLREQAQREFSVKRIEDDYETMDWCNYFLEKFWYFLEPSISQIVCDQANPILAGLPIPAFVTSAWLDSFTLGTKPPRIDKVKTLIGTADDVVVMDWGFSFTPNANVDANNKQLKNNVNECIVVKVSLFGITIPVAIDDVAFSGIARIRLRMMSSFPHIETVNVSMLEPPKFDFNTKLLGEASWWWEVLAIPGLYPVINELVKKYVGPIVFNPMSFQLNVQQLLAGNALDSAVGVLCINANSARGLRGFKTIGNTLDPYLTFGFRDKVLAKTKTISNTSAPQWKETVYIPVSSLSEPLNITVVDYNDFRKDRQVGAVQFDLESFVESPDQPNLTAAFLRNNKPVGELSFGMKYMPVLMPVKQADGATQPPPDLNTGVARIEIAEARHLKGGDKGASTSAELVLDNKSILKTPVQKNTNTPGWGASTERIVFNRAKAKVKVIIKDANGKTLGQIVRSLNELIDSTQVDSTWFPLSSGGEVRITTNWKSVEMEGASGAGGYTPPIGVVRVGIEHAEDLRNLETIGKVDPYARLLVNGFERVRTAAVESSLNPTWNEIHYVSVSSPNQKLTIEVMDVESHSADRTLGSFDVKLNEFIQKDELGEYIEHVDKKERTGKLIHKKGPKGSVTYTISFYPALPVMTEQDYKDEAEQKEKLANDKKKLEQDEKEAANHKVKKNEAGQEIKKENEDQEEVDDDELDDGDDYSRKLRLSIDELIEYKSGILVFEIIEANISKTDTYLQVYSSNQGYPDFMTRKLKKKSSVIEITGDSTITQLEWAETCFRLVKAQDDNRVDKCVAECTIPTLQLLKNGSKNPMPVELGSGNTFKILFSWIPLIYKSGIPPQDSIDNSGILNVEVLSAKGLPSSDRNGKSDPYMKVFLNSEKDPFTKTKVVKKTLDPTWNHKDTVEVANKYDSVLRFESWDWDMANPDDFLGEGFVELSAYDMKEGAVEIEIPLQGEQGEPAGTAYAKLSFRPEFVLSVKPKGSSTIGGVSTVGKGVGKGVGTVGKGVGKGLGGVGKGVGKGLGGGIKGIKKGLHIGS